MLLFMQSGRLAAAWLTGVFAVATIQGATQPLGATRPLATNDAPALRVRLDLRDGSRIIGVPVSTQISVQTSIGVIAVDLTRLESCVFQGNQEAALVFRNGDRLTGTIGQATFGLETCFGPARIPLAHIVRLGIAPANAAGTWLVNVAFSASKKTGKAATGLGPNDVWNNFAFPREATGTLEKLKFADGLESGIGLTLDNGGGYWSNHTGDPMFDYYVYPNGAQGDGQGDMTITITNLPPGLYDLYLYGYAEPGGRGPHHSIFKLATGGRKYGPAAIKASVGWKATEPWKEGFQYVVLKEVQIEAGQAAVITVTGGIDGQPGGVAVINGLQIAPAGLLVPASPEK
jgi:hypothetical protein